MSPPPDASELADLDARVHGSVLTPTDENWEEARRIWNGRLDRRPAAVVRCAGAEDVVSALDFAGSRGLAPAVRSGGHGYAGHGVCEDGLVLDLSAMADVAVAPDAGTVRAGPGATWGEVDARTQELGLATPGATVSTVGVAGYTLGGGTGHLARRFGLSADNLRSAQVVTPDRGLVRASETANPDLFWALRGAGANVGVVTALEYDLHEVGPEVLAGQTVYPWEAAPEVLRGYREVMAEAPDELTCYAFAFNVPPAPAFPEAHHGRPAVSMVVAWTGDVAAGEEWVRPLRSLGEPILDDVGPRPYVEVQKTFDAGVPEGLRWYSRAHYLEALPDGALDVFATRCQGLPGPFTLVYLEPLGGAIGRVDPSATAFPERDAAYSFHVLAGWQDPGEDHGVMAWVRGFHEDMASHASGGVYVNLLAEDEDDRTAAAYGSNLGRLREVKARWDPENLLRRNHNVEPP